MIPDMCLKAMINNFHKTELSTETRADLTRQDTETQQVVWAELYCHTNPH